MNPLSHLSSAAVVAALLVPLSPAEAAPAATCRGEAATIVGTPKGERLVGTPGPDVIVARGGNDVVRGRGGDDVVCGGDGADALRGGSGDDRLHGQREARVSDRGGTYFVPDLLDGGPGDDVLDTGGDARWVNFGAHGVLDYTAARAGVTVDLAAGTATGQGSDTLVVASGPDCDLDCYGTEVRGSAHDDVVSGTETNDDLVGNAGDDRIDGRGGADQLSADPSAPGVTGDDTLEGGPGDDFLTAHAGRDTLSGGDGRDTVWATRGGPSEVHGGAGDDRLAVWFPTDPGFVLDGGQGLDTGSVEGPDLAGAGGRPTAATVTAQDGLVVADGTEWGRITGTEDVGLYAELAWDYQGTDAAEIVRSAGTRLHATTFGGDDEIWGTEGRDRIDAGDGTDKVRAGGGRDTCLHAENVLSCEFTS
jgi:hypothetical protein